MGSKEKQSNGLKYGNQGNQAIGPPLPIQWPVNDSKTRQHLHDNAVMCHPTRTENMVEIVEQQSFPAYQDKCVP